MTRQAITNVHQYIRDVVLGEDASRTRSAYRAMAAVRNTVVGILHLHRVPNIAARLRANHRDPYQLPMQFLGLMTPLAPRRGRRLPRWSPPGRLTRTTASP
jgi:hypothetical protein